MNYRHLFRGKRLDRGYWVQGFLMMPVNRGQEEYSIQNPVHDGIVRGYCEIDPATLGQCTGLKDKNGRLIFEGDVLNRSKPDKVAGQYVVLWRGGRWEAVKTMIELKRVSSQFILTLPDNHSSFTHTLDVIDNEFLEIIGNVHDNPELLEVIE